MSSVRILAPAKVNLGLAVLGKRPDEFHELDTIMAMIGLYDEIVISSSPEPENTMSGMDDIPMESNVMAKAIHLWSEASGIHETWHIEIRKSIPSPGGVGGGSSDAAAVLTALNCIHDRPLSTEQLMDIAARIGADCPFFLAGPTARASGIGEKLRAVPSPSGWVVLVVPGVATMAKTATLYGALTPHDYGNHDEIDEIARLLTDNHFSSVPLPNSFTRVAYEAFPMLTDLRMTFAEVAGNVSLSGSGPALYAIANTHLEADAWSAHLTHYVPTGVSVFTAPFLKTPPQPEMWP